MLTERQERNESCVKTSSSLLRSLRSFFRFSLFRYGFVEFEDNRDADDAVYELNGKDLCGERVVVEHARGPRRDRDGYGGGHWGGGGGRSKCSLLQDTLSSLCSWGEVSKWTAQKDVSFFLSDNVKFGPYCQSP